MYGIQDQDGFQGCGSWYKGNLHSHTTLSDGVLTPEEAAAAFREKGYSFLCISDHNRYSDLRRELNREDFIILPGLEAAAVLEDAAGTCIKTHHINGILGTEEMQRKAGTSLFKPMEDWGPFVYRGNWDGVRAGQEIIDLLHDKGCIVTYNHPVWSRVEPQELLALKQIDMLEIFNYNTENESGTGYDTYYWDVMLRNGVRVWADAADDNHNRGYFDDAFGGFIMVKAQMLTHDAIINALLQGNYYSSSGPVIEDWGIRAAKVFVTCSPESEIARLNIIADGYVGSGRTFLAEEGKALTFCEMPLTGKESYVRAECIDWKGRRAWTNPLFLKRN